MGILTAAAVTVAAAGTAASISASRKAASAQGQANKLQRQQMALQQAREKREAVRAARIARGRAVNTAANQGVMDSSGAQGGQGSIGSQLNYDMSFLDKQEKLADQASAALGRARIWESRASGFGAVSSLALNAGSLYSSTRGS